MIIRSKAPLRLGLAGGGSDVSPYSDIYGGLILNATINLYAYCTIEETRDNNIVLNSYDSNCFKCYPSTKRMEIDGEASLIKGVYNRVIKDYDLDAKSFKITTYNDAPAGSGLGTSSTMVVCILKCFVEWLGLPLGDYEISQYAATFGGFNYMEFLQNDMVIVNPLKIKRWIIDELEASMLLFFTGKSRSSAAIIEEQKKNTSSGESDAIEAMHIAMAAGAKAGKVSGAGGGGFIMFIVEPTHKKEVEEALKKLHGLVMPFQFSDGGAHGWKIYPTDTVGSLSIK